MGAVRFCPTAFVERHILYNDRIIIQIKSTTGGLNISTPDPTCMQPNVLSHIEGERSRSSSGDWEDGYGLNDLYL